VKKIQTYIAVNWSSFQITISNSLIIDRRLKNSRIGHEKFIEEIICQLLNEPKPKTKNKTKNHFVTYINPLKKRYKREKYKRCGKLTMWECETCLQDKNHNLYRCVPKCFKDYHES